MFVTYFLFGLWLASLSVPAGWIMGAKIGDTGGVFGYVAGMLAIAAGIAAGIAS